MQALILASSSPYRRELLSRLGLAFTVTSPNIDETPRVSELPADLVARLALEKAHAVAGANRDAIIIGSDQIAVFDGSVLGKPGDLPRARAQLRQFSAKEVEFLTAVCVVAPGRDYCSNTTCRTVVRFRTLGEPTINAYLEAEQPFDCAGSFKAEGLGIALFESISSDDPTALTGLPLIAVVSALGELGVAIPAPATS